MKNNKKYLVAVFIWVVFFIKVNMCDYKKFSHFHVQLKCHYILTHFFICVCVLGQVKLKLKWELGAVTLRPVPDCWSHFFQKISWVNFGSNFVWEVTSQALNMSLHKNHTNNLEKNTAVQNNHNRAFQNTIFHKKS